MFEATSENIGKRFSVQGREGVYLGCIALQYTLRDDEGRLFFTYDSLEILPVGFVPVQEALKTHKATKVTTEEV